VIGYADIVNRILLGHGFRVILEASISKDKRPPGK
jgi:hypothetical protein